MKNKLRKTVVWLIAVFAIFLNLFSICEAGETRTVGEAQSFIDGIVAYQLKEAGASSVQQWINDSLTKNAGVSSEWYVIGLSQNGSFDFSAYQRALLSYLAKNQVSSASSRQKYALALIATGSTDSYIYETLQNSIGQQGVMSWIYGLHLLNNGYTSQAYSVSDVKSKLLSLQLGDGGWAISGSYGDVDVTAMAVQALAPYYGTDSSVRSGINRALSFLSREQKDSGEYASYGVNNPESGAQVLTALSALEIDCENDNRFIKNGNTIFDGIRLYRLSDGSFCHKLGGGSNGTATVQVFYSMVSYLRMQNGRSSFYILDARNPAGLVIPSQGSGSGNGGTNPPAGLTGGTGGAASGVSNSSGAGDGSLAGQAESPVENPEDESTGGDGNAPSETDGTLLTEKTDKEETDDAENGGKASQWTRKKSVSYKPWVTLGILILAGGICVTLFCLKKRNRKNFLLILAVAAVAIVIVWVTDFQTTRQYYENADVAKEHPVGEVTLSIRCDTIVGKSDADYIPSDGIVLSEAEYEIEEGDTVYDILLEAVSKNQIHLETSGSDKSVYVKGIHHIYEFAFGDLSGWMYFVNGKEPSLSCGEYELSAGDQIEWRYTCELGKDLP